MSIDSWGSFPRPFLPLEFVTTLFATLLMLLVPLCCVLVFIFGHHSLDGGSEICFFPCLFLVLPWIKYRCYIFIDFLILLPGHVVGTFLSGSRHLVNCEGTRKACPFDHSRLLSRSCLGSVTLYHLSRKVRHQLQLPLKFLRDVGVRKLVYPALVCSCPERLVTKCWSFCTLTLCPLSQGGFHENPRKRAEKEPGLSPIAPPGGIWLCPV